jgi:hypothetical protein
MRKYRPSFFVASCLTFVGLITMPAIGSNNVTYQGKPATVSIVGNSNFSATLPTTKLTGAQTKGLPARQLRLRTPGTPLRSKSNPGAPVVDASEAAVVNQSKSASVLYNFNGLSNLDNGNLTGFIFEPPDQGLCVGNILGQKYVVEMVNITVGFYQPNGTLVSEQDFGTFFQDSDLIISDPRCTYDKQNHTFFMSIVGTDDATESHFDLAVLNGDTGAITLYRYDDTDLTNPYGDCPCLGDQPHLGIDDNAVFISVDEFSLVQPLYNGASVYVLSKADLLAGNTATASIFSNIAIANIPVITLMPAISYSSTNTEYLLNTFPYDQFGNGIAFTHFIGYWTITGFPTAPLLTGVVEPTEQYAFPVLAETTPPGNTLNPNDDRISQVEYLNGKLWSCVVSALQFKGQIGNVDGAAWFQLAASDGSVQNQGYIGAANEFLIYPSFLHSSFGLTTLNFTITDPTLNPSTGFVNMKNPRAINITATGYDPYITLFFRWGDYSASVLDPNGQNIWMANEYVPPPSFQTFELNWGTEVFEQ